MTDTPMSPERAAPTVEDALRLIRKIEACEGNAAKLILLRHFAVKVREQALEEAARVCEELVEECSKSRETRPNCHNLDAQIIRELKESQ